MTMCTWNYAYRAARKGGWEQIARDHDRFQRRIREIESIIRPVLNMNHRQKIFDMLKKQNGDCLDEKRLKFNNLFVEK